MAPVAAWINTGVPMVVATESASAVGVVSDFTVIVTVAVADVPPALVAV